MNSSLYKELRYSSIENNESKAHIRIQNASKLEKEYSDRENASNRAAGELFQRILNNGKLFDDMYTRANDGYFDLSIFSVSFDPSMDMFSSHEPGKAYMITNFNGVVYTFTYRSLFWTKRWNELFGEFDLKYRWNKPRTLLSVYVSWCN